MYKKMTLSYEYNSLEPYIDTRTMGIHYENHYLGYLNRLNKFLNQTNYDYKYSLEELVDQIDKFDVNIRDNILFNLGGVLNHNLYFNSISPDKNNLPVGKLKQAIEKKYGTFENFKEEFKKKANLLVGSGYTFLVIKSDNEIDIINTSNQDTPLSYGFTPIMALDLWEHAYYLRYQSDRQSYINNFFEIVDFNNINDLYEKHIK